MEAIKKITSIQNNTLVIQGLNSINNKEVEVIILPLSDSEKNSTANNGYSLHGKLLKYKEPFEPAISEEDWEVLK